MCYGIRAIHDDRGLMYGSVFPRLIERIIDLADITAKNRFIDIGSGIGNVSPITTTVIDAVLTAAHNRASPSHAENSTVLTFRQHIYCCNE
jgi:Histone methylation protein DOT1